jgi:putative DNA methylase
VNPNWQEKSNEEKAANSWHAAAGLSEDIRYYGQWMRDEAERRIGNLFPKIEITEEMADGRPDLKPLVGQRLLSIACIWARTVKSPNPAFRRVDVPLVSTFLLSAKPGREAHVEPIVENGGYRFDVKVGESKNADAAKGGTKLGRGSNFRCVISGEPISGDYIKAEGKAGRLGVRMMAIVAEGKSGRIYLPPTRSMEAAAAKAKPTWRPETTISGSTQYLGVKPYGMDRFDQIFTDRQLVVLNTFSDLIREVHAKIAQDAAVVVGLQKDTKPFREGGVGTIAYADAVATYLEFVVGRVLHYGSAICAWLVKDAAIARTFTKQAIPMTWDFAEGNVFGKSSAEWTKCCEVVAQTLAFLSSSPSGYARLANAASVAHSSDAFVISTDPPYYDNVPYADLSDFFYLWHRRALKDIFPDLFATITVPKAEELVAFAYRHDSKASAEAFFLEGMTRALAALAVHAHPAFPVTIYYAFKQSESDSEEGTVSTGWETFLEAVVRSGFAIQGTWPMRTEGDNRQRGVGSNALASSIVLVCRPRLSDAPTATRRSLITALKTELPIALAYLQRSNIAPVDLAQAAIGPGMAVYTRYSKVLDAEGKAVAVRDALSLINQALDEVLAEQEGDFDGDTRWSLAWFEQYGFASAEYGVAETLSKAKNTSVSGLVEAGILASKAGKVRLLKPVDLPEDWDPTTDKRLTVWEMVHHLIRVLEAGGESAAAVLAAKMGSKTEIVRELAYRLYTLCERKKRAPEALAYNGLVQSWPEITRLAREGSKPTPGQTKMFEEK